MKKLVIILGMLCMPFVSAHADKGWYGGADVFQLEVGTPDVKDDFNKYIGQPYINGNGFFVGYRWNKWGVRGGMYHSKVHRTYSADWAVDNLGFPTNLTGTVSVDYDSGMATVTVNEFGVEENFDINGIITPGTVAGINLNQYAGTIPIGKQSYAYDVDMMPYYEKVNIYGEAELKGYYADVLRYWDFSKFSVYAGLGLSYNEAKATVTASVNNFSYAKSWSFSSAAPRVIGGVSYEFAKSWHVSGEIIGITTKDYQSVISIHKYF